MKQTIIIRKDNEYQEYKLLINEIIKLKQDIKNMSDLLSIKEKELESLMLDSEIKTIGDMISNQKITLIPSKQTKIILGKETIEQNLLNESDYEIIETKEIKKIDIDKLAVDLEPSKIVYQIKETKPSFRITNLEDKDEKEEIDL